jgi:sugar/nucleoside kinase (ribokinase family)
VFGDFRPKLSEDSRAAEMVFLGNIQPDLQREVRAQCEAARFVALDSMNLWIETTKDALLKAIAEVHCLVLNDAELRMLTGEANLARAAGAAMDLGPGVVVAKRGEYGAALFHRHGVFAIPGYLLEDVRDPTGAGDSFAGGFLGYLDGAGGGDPDDATLRRAMAYGSVLASFNVEDFGTERVAGLKPDEIEERYEAFRRLSHFDQAALPSESA